MSKFSYFLLTRTGGGGGQVTIIYIISYTELCYCSLEAQSTYTYTKSTTCSVCPLVGIGTLPTPLSPASVPPAGEGLGESQLRRLEKKFSLCLLCGLKVCFPMGCVSVTHCPPPPLPPPTPSPSSSDLPISFSKVSLSPKCQLRLPCTYVYISLYRCM